MIAWLVATKAGRWLAGVAGAVLAVLAILWVAFSKGKDAATAEIERRQQADALEATEQAGEIENEVARNSDARGGRDRLRRWSRPD